MKKLLLLSVLTFSSLSVFADVQEKTSELENRRTCFAFLKVDPYIIGMVGYKLFVEKSDGKIIQVEVRNPNTGNQTSDKREIERALPGIENQLRRSNMCDYLIYEGERW